MSIEIITCNRCGSRTIELSLRFRYESGRCDTCHHHESSETSFHFCSVACMAGWMEVLDAANLGLPCPRCVDYSTGLSTGFIGGFAINGSCETCGGRGRLTRARRIERKLDPERAALQEAFGRRIDEAGGYEAYVAKLGKRGNRK